ncbi:hypothetical protein E2C01_085980 [Portunus trituberculatus]|uniref:Uncharacterized protein n=1 Tax=Portunus trituberculatus TaxID=210409 RepID=A0A5B7J492_PORTR|nr:hypothetical protein [Portunus trituberculatus]
MKHFNHFIPHQLIHKVKKHEEKDLHLSLAPREGGDLTPFTHKAHTGVLPQHSTPDGIHTPATTHAKPPSHKTLGSISRTTCLTSFFYFPAGLCEVPMVLASDINR